MPRRRTLPLPLPLRLAPVALTALLLSLVLGLFLGPAPASAHAVLEHSAPADASVLDAAPSSVVLTFDEPVGHIGAAARVTGPSGAVATGSPSFSGSSVELPLQGDQPAGAYTLSWRVVSDDGHPVSGQVHWMLQDRGTATPLAAAPAGGSQHGAPAQQSGSRQSSGQQQGDGGSFFSQHGGHLLIAWAVILVGVGYLGFDVWRRRRPTGPR